MKVQHIFNQKNGNFFIEENGKQMAYLAYVYAGETKFIIDHTEVMPGNEGRGLGKLLVIAAVEFAREKGFKILPLCPFAKSVFERNELFNDVLF